VFRTSIRYTFQHPLFGVGPQQFAAYEGGHERVRGTHGYWHDTHCSFTQASAECGIPGFLFFAGGTLSTLLLLYKTFRQARRRTDCQDMRIAIFCIMLGVVGFDVAITFLNFAYFFYFPALAGLATGVWSAAQREFQIRDAALQAGTA
jgi:O-antigen ligase